MTSPYKKRCLESTPCIIHQLKKTNFNQENPLHLSSNDRSRRSICWDNQSQEQSTPMPDGPLFERSQLNSTWITQRTIGPGILNNLNNCFLNSVLECLTYTPSLAQYFLYHGHEKQCTLNKFCAMCLMENHVHRCLEKPSSWIKGFAIYPWNFLVNLKALSQTLRIGRQEDAHEFMVCLLDAMHQSTVQKYGVLDTNLERTAFIYQIFGGQLRSQLRCHNCNAKSDTFDNFLDLSIDLQGADSVFEAMKNFIKVDRIGGNDSDTKYQCESCNQKVDAEKRMTIHELPSCLCVHLKRFTFDMNHGVMAKLVKDIRYGENLDMVPFVSEEVDSPSTVYKLYAVLVHCGDQCDSGHYFAYVKAPDGKWFQMDDDEVIPVTIVEVLSQQAYMLFYIKKDHPLPQDTVNESTSIDILCHPAHKTTATTEQFSQMIHSQPLSPTVYSEQLSPSVRDKQLSQVVISSQLPQAMEAATVSPASPETSPLSNTTISQANVPEYELDTIVNENTAMDDNQQLVAPFVETFNEKQDEHFTISAWSMQLENQPLYSLRGYISPPSFTANYDYVLDYYYDNIGNIQSNDGQPETNGSSDGGETTQDSTGTNGQEKNRSDA